MVGVTQKAISQPTIPWGSEAGGTQFHRIGCILAPGTPSSQATTETPIMNTTTDTSRLHLSLNVRDIERSVDFYTSFLGQAPAKLRADYAKFEVQDPGLILTLNAVPDAARGNALSHLGLRVDNDARLHSEKDRIEATGIPIELEEDHVTCCYAVQNKFWVRDPDGNAWEIYRFLVDANAKSNEDAETETVESCCPTNLARTDPAC